MVQPMVQKLCKLVERLLRSVMRLLQACQGNLSHDEVVMLGVHGTF